MVTATATATRLLARALPAAVTDEDHRLRCQLLLPHVRQVVERAVAAGVEMESAAWLLDRAGTYFDAIGDLGSAQRNLAAALELRRSILSIDAPEVLLTMSGLAGTLSRAGDLEQARLLYQHVLDVNWRTWGEESPASLIAMDDLAMTLGAMGEHDEAARLADAAASIRRRVRN